MKNFIALTDLPVFDLHAELNKLVSEKGINWDRGAGQICLNHVEENSDDVYFGVGSLSLDWDKKYTVITDSGEKKIVIPEREVKLQESDFKYLCTPFKGTLFEEVYTALASKYTLGRVRLMSSDPKTSLSWHVDLTPRVHYPVKTQLGCFMVIEDEIMHLPQNTWWYTNTVPYHTAFNASLESRIHLVAVTL